MTSRSLPLPSHSDVPAKAVGPVRIQRSRKAGWKMPPDTVCVTRPGRWGNPFPLSIGRDLAVKMFDELMHGFFSPYHLAHLSDDEFRPVFDAKERFQKRLNWGVELRAAARSELGGKNLACWCPLGQPCHADVLLELANAP